MGGVVRELEKLSRLRSANTRCLAVWIAYAIPDKIPATWSQHSGRIQRAASLTHCIEVIPLWPGQCAHLHIMEPLPPSGRQHRTKGTSTLSPARTSLAPIHI